jgi:hypothetical protein
LLFAYTQAWKGGEAKMPRYPNDDGVNESQPPGSIPDFEDADLDLPLGDLEAGIAAANLAILEEPELSDFAEDELC